MVFYYFLFDNQLYLMHCFPISLSKYLLTVVKIFEPCGKNEQDLL